MRSLSPLAIHTTSSRAGRRAVERLTRRGDAVLDAKTLRRAGRIVQAVRRTGDRALLGFARELDGAETESVAGLALAPLPGDAQGSGLPAGFADALEQSIEAVRTFYQPQAQRACEDFRQMQDGADLREVVTPLRRIGIYVPGGRAAYPSTVVMTVVPAQEAGVKEIAVATPPGSYRGSPALRYALATLGVTEVWGMGGAHAVAAFAYGTETIRRVDKIVGPGNAWVTAAKKLVVGDVAIDGIAGPSEVLIVADATADPADLAADLLAQAEHDPLAAAVLITPDRGLAERVSEEVERQLADLPTAETARASLEKFGAALVVAGMEEALELAELIAPEHLQLVGPAAEALADRITAAGAVFLGSATPEVFGDYIAGPSHVLPTCGSARFASSLGVEDFLRRSHRIRFTPEAAARRAEPRRLPGRRRGPARPCCLGAEEGVMIHKVDPAALRPARIAPPVGHTPGPDAVPAQAGPERGALGPAATPQGGGGRPGSWTPTGPAIRISTPTPSARTSGGCTATRGRGSWSATARTSCSAWLSRPWCRPASEVLGAEPSFGLYRPFVLKAGGVPRFLPPRPDLRLPADEIEAEVERNPRRPVLLCYAEQPHGRCPAAGPRSSSSWSAWRRRSSSTTPMASSAAGTTGRSLPATRTWSSSAPSPRPGRSPGCGSAICWPIRAWSRS